MIRVDFLPVNNSVHLFAADVTMTYEASDCRWNSSELSCRLQKSMAVLKMSNRWRSSPKPRDHSQTRPITFLRQEPRSPLLSTRGPQGYK